MLFIQIRAHPFTSPTLLGRAQRAPRPLPQLRQGRVACAHLLGHRRPKLRLDLEREDGTGQSCRQEGRRVLECGKCNQDDIWKTSGSTIWQLSISLCRLAEVGIRSNPSGDITSAWSFPWARTAQEAIPEECCEAPGCRHTKKGQSYSLYAHRRFTTQERSCSHVSEDVREVHSIMEFRKCEAEC